MRRLTSIVAVNAQGVIGLGNALPWRVKSDMRFFKEQTAGNIVIMGRKTHDSLGGCLPNRYNIVLSRQLALFEDTENCVLQYGIFDALAAAEATSASYKDVFIIGGSTMYEQFADLVDRYLITIVDKEVTNGDAFFDQGIIGNDSCWEISHIKSGTANSSGDEASFEIFELIARDGDRRREERAAGVALVAEKMRSNARRGRVSKAANISERTQFSLSMIG